MEAATSTSSTNVIKCELCDVMCSGVISYQSHINGKPHSRMLSVQNAAMKNTLPATLNIADNIIKCQICNIECSGVISYEAHIKGKPHFRKMAAQNIEMASEDNTEAGDAKTPKSKKRIAASMDESIRCELCDVLCQDQFQYDVHIGGIRHAKNVTNKEPNSKPLESEFIKETQIKGIFECTACNVNLSGVASVVAHTNGAKHRRNISPEFNKNLAPGLTSKKRKIEQIKCEVCSVVLNSAFQVNEHMSSVRHKHKAELAALQEQQNPTETATVAENYDAWDPSA